MSELNFVELYEKYNGVPLRFSHYYKYAFTFEGEHEGQRLSCYIGGDNDDIYRFEVCADKTYTLAELGVDKVEKHGETLHFCLANW